MAATALTPAEVEAKIDSDEFKLVGDYVPGLGFVDPDLNTLLNHYCELDKVDPKKMDPSGMPAWFLRWQELIPAVTEWTAATQGRAGVAEAYLRWNFRQLCKKAGVNYAEASDEFFAELFKSSDNGRAADFAKGVSWEPQDVPANNPKKPSPPEPHEKTPTFETAPNALPLNPPAPKPASSTADGKPAATAKPPAPAGTSGDGTVLYNPPPPQNELESRMRAAWHSARIEISKGYLKYGDGKWTTGPNTGPLIDIYQNAAYSTPGPSAPWCGIFQAWNYRQAGIKADEKIDKKFQITGNAAKRVFVFWSTLRLIYYWQAAKSPFKKFPYEKFGTWKRDDCVKWLKDNLNAYNPVPGDLLVLDTYKPLAHVGMVGGYDPDTFRLITYEGNCGDKAAAHQWDLAAPTKQGFFRMNYIGRMLESDFGDPGQVQPEGPSPDPKVGGATTATGRYGG